MLVFGSLFLLCFITLPFLHFSFDLFCRECMRYIVFGLGWIAKPTYCVVVYLCDGVVAIVWGSSVTRAIVQTHQFIVHIEPNLYKCKTPSCYQTKKSACQHGSYFFKKMQYIRTKHQP